MLVFVCNYIWHPTACETESFTENTLTKTFLKFNVK